MLAKAIAKKSSAVFISTLSEFHFSSNKAIDFDQAQIFQHYVGESEKMLAALFSLAKKFQPAIIFIDEVDSFFGARGTSGDSDILLRLQCMLLRYLFA